MDIKAKDIIGLKVMTLDEGKFVDRVKDIIYDADKNKVVALLIDDKGLFKDAKVILIEDIKSIGKDDVVIQSAELLKNASEVEKSVANIARSNNYLTATKIVTTDGSELGSVSDIFFDPSSGNVDEFEVSQGPLKDVQGGRKKVKVSNIVTVGEDATVVSSYTEEEFEQQSQEQGLQGKLNDAKEGINQAVSGAKDKIEDVKNNPQVQENVNNIKEGINKAADTLNEKAKEVVAKTKQKANDVKNNSGDIKAQAEELKDKAQDKISDVKRQGEEKVDELKQNIDKNRRKNKHLY